MTDELPEVPAAYWEDVPGASLPAYLGAGIIQFEGEPVTKHQVKLPGVVVDALEGFRRGSVLRLAVEVRVKDVLHRETKDGLTRLHTLSYESVNVISAFRPEQEVVVNSQVRGPEEPESADPLGIEFRRSSDDWPAASVTDIRREAQ